MAPSFHFDEIQHLTAGTVGPKGNRIFYLQFGMSGEIVTVKLEKTQVDTLAEFLDQLLENAGPVAADEVPLALDLIDPIEPAWTVGGIGVAHEPDQNRFVLVIEQLVEEEGEEPATAEVRATPGQIQAFITKARESVVSGRPPCAFCGRPLDGNDTWCPCSN